MIENWDPHGIIMQTFARTLIGGSSDFGAVIRVVIKQLLCSSVSLGIRMQYSLPFTVLQQIDIGIDILYWRSGELW